MTIPIICALMVVVHANIRTKAEDEAFRELHTTYTEYGRSIDFADCVVNILRERNATKDFQDFTKVIDPETNSNRLVEHLQLKAANTIQMLCENKVISYISTLMSSCATVCYRCNLIIYLSMFLQARIQIINWH